MLTGQCECGAVTYEIRGKAREVVACHCGQCRRSSGHYWAATACDAEDLVISGAASLTWYESSPGVRRGFCAVCGASLFWDKDGEDHISIGAGTLNGQTGLTMAKHIYLEDKGDYYEVSP